METTRGMQVETERTAGLPADSRGRTWIGRLADRVKRRLEPVLTGFDEHAWSGKLYLLVSGLGVLTSVAGGLGFVILLAMESNIGGRAGMLPIAVIFALIAWVQWKLLSGVARFRNWARRIAILVSGFALLAGVNLIVFAGLPRMMILGLAQTALSIQFIAYFVRERDRFLGAGDG